MMDPATRYTLWRNATSIVKICFLILKRVNSKFYVSVVQCPNPESPEHGSVNTRGIEFTFGQVITYGCDQGYKIVGDSEGVCNADGNWGQLPVCESKTPL